VATALTTAVEGEAAVGTKGGKDRVRLNREVSARLRKEQNLI
jgi:hypothetical protein